MSVVYDFVRFIVYSIVVYDIWRIVYDSCILLPLKQ